MKHILLIAALALSTAVHAEDLMDSNGNLWTNYVGDHQIGSGPWGIHLEAQMRRADMGDHWQQLLLRPGVNYTISPTLSLSAGYAFVDTYRYGDFPAVATFPEHRLWEQVTWTHKGASLEWIHRFRLEQRRIGEMGLGDDGDYEVKNFRFENRFRYMLRTSIPLTSSGRTYLALWDEVFFNFGSNVSRNYFDQNRAFVGLGYKVTPTNRLEAGFLEQTLQRRGGNIWENNHTLAIWWLSKTPFGSSAAPKIDIKSAK
jgi:hypothetical protein